MHLERTMLARRMIATLLIAAAAVANGPALGQGKVVVYTSNDSNLNRFTFEAFKKETGIEVEQVEAGSGVILRRMASERERPLGRHHLGREPHAAARQQGAARSE